MDGTTGSAASPKVGGDRENVKKAGKTHLTKEVRWVSDFDGDGGYDVQPFELNGEPRLLEIKTTCGNERTPFWMTKRECAEAEQGGIYHARWVSHFRNEVKMFDIAAVAGSGLRLTPATFLARPR